MACQQCGWLKRPCCGACEDTWKNAEKQLFKKSTASLVLHGPPGNGKSSKMTRFVESEEYMRIHGIEIGEDGKRYVRNKNGTRALIVDGFF